MNDEDEVIIYKKEKPLLKLLLWFVGAIVAAVVLLFITGFIMGLLDIRPPTLDSQVAQNQWDKVNGKETTEPPSELDKVKTTPTETSDTETSSTEMSNDEESQNG